MSERIRIKLKSFDHNLVDKSAEKIVKTINAVKDGKVVVVGPIPLPTHKKIFTVNRSTFVNKKSREQFELFGIEINGGQCNLWTDETHSRTGTLQFQAAFTHASGTAQWC